MSLLPHLPLLRPLVLSLRLPLPPSTTQAPPLRPPNSAPDPNPSISPPPRPRLLLFSIMMMSSFSTLICSSPRVFSGSRFEFLPSLLSLLVLMKSRLAFSSSSNPIRASLQEDCNSRRRRKVLFRNIVPNVSVKRRRQEYTGRMNNTRRLIIVFLSIRLQSFTISMMSTERT